MSDLRYISVTSANGFDMTVSLDEICVYYRNPEETFTKLVLKNGKELSLTDTYESINNRLSQVKYGKYG